MQQERPELVAESEVASSILAYRLHVEVGPGKKLLFGASVRYPEWDEVVRVAQLYKVSG